MFVRINPSASGIPIRTIGISTDFCIVIPLVLEGMPPWVVVHSTNKRREVPWRKGSVVYVKGGTHLVCSERGGGIYIIVGAKIKGQS